MSDQKTKPDQFKKKRLPNPIYKGIRCLRYEGPAVFIYKLKNKIMRYNEYDIWLKQNEKDIYETENISYCPMISVVVPVYNVQEDFLVACIESVMEQTYQNWELCLVDDCSTLDCVFNVLSRYEGRDKVKIHYRKENGHISRATNTGFAMASGEFVALLDCDDLLAPNALYEMAKLLNNNPDYDFIYSDEDKLSEDGRKRRNPFFKPDWSPDTFMSLMYTCHFSVFRKSLIDELGGMRVGLEGSQDYDLVLRVMERTENIGHVPKILYHWRERNESTAKDIAAKPYILEATIKAKEDALKRRGLSGRLEFLEEVTMYRVVYDVTNHPKVSIIIPSKDHPELLRQCIQTITENTSYDNYEIVVVDNGSNEENKKQYQEMLDKINGRYVYKPKDFNFSWMCNEGAKVAAGDYYLFLNDDIEIKTKDHIERMLGHAQLDHIGAVGCKLLYPDTNRIQHAGVVSFGVGPGHAFHDIDDSINCYWGRNILDYNYSAVTGACLMISRKKYEKIDGFDENLPVAYNDVDFCFKLVEMGYYNVIRNDVKHIHHESVSRGYDDVSQEKRERQYNEMNKLYEKHPEFRGYDPCFNLNFAQDRDDFSLKIKMKKERIEM